MPGIASSGEPVTSTTEAERNLEDRVEGLRLESNNRRTISVFHFKRDPTTHRVINISAFLYLISEYLLKPWELRLNLKSFEVMHGLSRVVLLTPDKLATAIAINKEDLPDPDDGGFLVQLVQDLVTFYKGRAANPQTADVVDVESRVVEVGGAAQEDGFSPPAEKIQLLDVLEELSVKLNSIQENLRLRNPEGINSDCDGILVMADDILELSTIYMDFIHPIYLDIERHGIFNEEKIVELRAKVNEKLIENKRKLQDEFDGLTKPRQTEE